MVTKIAFFINFLMPTLKANLLLLTMHLIHHFHTSLFPAIKSQTDILGVPDSIDGILLMSANVKFLTLDESK